MQIWNWKEVNELMAMIIALNIIELNYDYNNIKNARLIKQVDAQLKLLGFKIVDGQPVALDAE